MIKLFTNWISRQLARFGGWLVRTFGVAPEPVSVVIEGKDEGKIHIAVRDAFLQLAREVRGVFTPPLDKTDEYEWRRALRELIHARDAQSAKEQELWIGRELGSIEMAIQSEKPELLVKALRDLLKGLEQDRARARMT